MTTSPALQTGFEHHIHYSRGVLRICDDLYQLDSCSRVLTVAFGGLAHEMAALLVAHLGPLAQGVISTPHLAGQAQIPGFRYFYGAHPFPNHESLRSADAIVKSLGSLDSNAIVIYLISAGSSIMEKPTDGAISVEDLAQAYKMLSESSVSSGEAKAILKHLSAVKGGHLAITAGKSHPKQVSILACTASMTLDALACGPTMPDRTTAEECYRIAEQHELMDRFPDSIRELFVRRALDETPDNDHPAFHNCRWWPIID